MLKDRLEKQWADLGSLEGSWDSCGAKPPTKEALEAARALAAILPCKYWPVPTVAGGVSLELSLFDGEIEFCPGGFATWSFEGKGEVPARYICQVLSEAYPEKTVW